MSETLLKAIHDDVKENRSECKEIRVQVTKNTASLEYHIKRTDELQDLVKKVAEDNIKIKQTYVTLTKVGGAVLTLLGATWTVIKIVEML